MTDLIGQTIAHYHLTALLGEGGTGRVYEAADLKLGRTVAVKVVHPHLAGRSEFQTRFVAEAHLAMGLEHPAIVKTYDLLLDPLCLVMECLAGGDLPAYLAQLRHLGLAAPAVTLVALGRQLAAALAHAHDRGVRHGDVKPGNILRRAAADEPAAPLGDVALVDFGLAALLRATTQADTNPYLGTPAYLAPEQFQGGPVDERADLYALGVTLYEVAAGRPPFVVGNWDDAARQHTLDAPPPLAGARPDLPAELVAVIARLLAKSPDDRFPSTAAVVAALSDLKLPVAVAPIAPIATPPPATARPVTQLAVIERPGGRSTEQTGDTGEWLTVSPAARRAVDLNRQEIITIGRDAGNHIVLDADTVSLRHATAQWTPRGWQIIDCGSTNGVFLDGVRLLHDVPEPWLPEQTLAIGPFFLQLHAPEPSSRAGDRLAVMLSPAAVNLAPGVMAQARIVIRNITETRQYVQVTLFETPPWLELPQDALPLAPEQEGRLLLNVRPPPDTPPGVYPYRLAARSLSGGREEVVVAGSIQIERISRFALSCGPDVMPNNGLCRVTITNEGNAATTYKLLVRGEGGGARFAYVSDQKPTGRLATGGPAVAPRAVGHAPALPELPQPLRHSARWRLLDPLDSLRRQLRSGRRQGQRWAEAAGIDTATGVASVTDLEATTPVTSTAAPDPNPGRFTDELHRTVVVAPRTAREIVFAVRARRRPWLGRRLSPIPLLVMVTGDGDRRQWPGQLQPTPVVPWWSALALAGVLLLLCMATTLLLSMAGYENRQTLILTRQAAATSAAADNDSDSLSNGAELLSHHTRPDASDTDGDTLSDNTEIINETDPLHFDEDIAARAATPVAAPATPAAASTPATLPTSEPD
jgi:serine/threonine-protein kinase